MFGCYAALMLLTGFAWVLAAPRYPMCYFSLFYPPWVFAAAGAASVVQYYDRFHAVDPDDNFGLQNPTYRKRGYFNSENLTDSRLGKLLNIGLFCLLYA